MISALSMMFICLVMLYNLTMAPAKRLESPNDSIDYLFDLSRSESILGSIKFCFAYIIAVTLFYALKYWQQEKRMGKGEPRATPSVVFNDISRENSDGSFVNLVKYFVNYGFYKFGIEITLIMFIVGFFTRLDTFTIFYTFWFIVLVYRKREKAEIFWSLAATSVFLSLVVQCLIVAVLFSVPDVNQLETEKIYKFFEESITQLYKYPEIMTSDFILFMLMTSQV